VACGIPRSAHGFREISAAIPFGTLCNIRFEALVWVEQEGPNAHQPTLVKWESQRIVARRCVHRLETEEIRFDRERIGVCDVGVARKGHCRVKVPALPINSAVLRVQKVGVAILADTGFGVGRDVRGVKRPEGQDESQTSRERRTTGRRVAGLAVRSARQILAALHEAGARKLRGNTRRIGRVTVGDRHASAAREIHRAGTEHDP
jgi:hypothetical protein